MKRLSRFTKQEVSQMFKKARRSLRHPGLDIMFAPKEQETGRILVITSRRTGPASQRNRIRRRLKAIFYEEKLSERGFDCIVIVKKPGVDLNFDELKELLLKSLDQMEKA